MNDSVDDYLKLIKHALRTCYRQTRRIRKYSGWDSEDIFHECVIHVMTRTIPNWLQSDQTCKLSTYIYNGIIWYMGNLEDRFTRIPCQFTYQLRVADSFCWESKQHPSQKYERVPVESLCGRDSNPSDEASLRMSCVNVWQKFRQFLNVDQRDVIKHRFLQGRTCRETAKIMGLSAARISQIEKVALDILKDKPLPTGTSINGEKSYLKLEKQKRSCRKKLETMLCDQLGLWDEGVKP